MKKNASEKSKRYASAIFSLIFVLLQVSNLVFAECFTDHDLNKDNPKMIQIKNELIRMVNIANTQNQNQNPYLIGKGGFGYVFYDPTNPAIAIKVVNTNNVADAKAVLEEIEVLKQITHIDQNSGKQQIAPLFINYICYIRTVENFEFYIKQERFLGSMENAALQNGDFSSKMKNLGSRMKFYQMLLRSYQGLNENGFKHCDIKPQNIFYGSNKMFGRIPPESLDVEMMQQTTVDTSYYPAFADFGMTVQQNEPCPGGTRAFFEPNEYIGDVPLTEGYRNRIELFPLALSIFYMEFMFVYQWFIKDRLNLQPNWVPEWVEHVNIPEYIQIDINNPITRRQGPVYDLKSLINQSLDRVANFNLDNKHNKALGFKYSFETLKTEMEFYAKILDFYNRMANANKMDIMTQSFGNKQKTVNVFAQNIELYNSFTSLLIQMLRENNVVKGRPSLTDTLKKMDKIAASAIELSNLTKGRAKTLLSAQLSSSSDSDEETQIQNKLKLMLLI